MVHIRMVLIIKVLRIYHNSGLSNSSEIDVLVCLSWNYGHSTPGIFFDVVTSGIHTINRSSPYIGYRWNPINELDLDYSYVVGGENRISGMIHYSETAIRGCGIFDANSNSTTDRNFIGSP